MELSLIVPISTTTEQHHAGGTYEGTFWYWIFICHGIETGRRLVAVRGANVLGNSVLAAETAGSSTGPLNKLSHFGK